MLRLASTTDPRWVSLALEHMDAILVDHAHCEQKAAATALMLVTRYPDDPELVLSLSALAQEEAGHLQRVASLCFARKVSLGHPAKDAYVQGLLACVRRASLDGRVDRLLVCAFIEGRSTERLKLIADELSRREVTLGDEELVSLYRALWVDEARHHALFLHLAARSLSLAGVPAAEARALLDARVDDIARHEASVLAEMPLRPAIH